MQEIETFFKSVKNNIEDLGKDIELQKLSMKWLTSTLKHKYSYNFTWLGRPIIQYPQDITAIQELIWTIQPDLIIETGIAHGGSLILSASILALLDLFEAERKDDFQSVSLQKRKVLGIDIDIREHNRTEIENHPLSSRITMIEGSSTDPDIIAEVVKYSTSYNKILVLLDSNHTHDHVLAELNAYSSLVTPGSYCVVFDTIIEDLPNKTFQNRDWGKNNNPKTAVKEFLKTHTDFEVDKSIEHKLLVTVAPNGFLKKLR